MATVNATWKQKSTGNIIHPETDVDQLKSSGQNALASIITTLLKSATTAQARQAIESAAAVHQHSTGDIQSFASNVVSAIGEETLAALGVRYSITTNGYICFGQLFGGLILQWGMGTIAGSSSLTITYPVSFTSAPYPVVSGTEPTMVFDKVALINFTLRNKGLASQYTAAFSWFAIGH